QRAAIEALGAMGGKEQADKIANLLSGSNNPDVLSAAAYALGKMEAKQHADNIFTIFTLLSGSSDYRVLSAAAYALGKMEAKQHADKLVTLLSTSNDLSIQYAAAHALGQMKAKQHADKLVTLLSTSNNSSVQIAVTSALRRLGTKEYADNVAALLSTSNDSNVQSAAIEALGKMGAKQHADKIANLLSGSNNLNVQRVAIETLGKMDAKEHADNIATLLSTSNDSNVQSAAIETLGKMVAKEYAVQIAALLSDSNDSDVQSAAIETLGKMVAKEYAVQIAILLLTADNNFKGENVQEAVRSTLQKFGIANRSTILTILNAVLRNQWRASNYRFLAYFLSNANEETLTLIKWLGSPQEYPDLENHEQAVKTLQVFKEAWQPSASLPRLRNDLEKQIARVVKEGKWKFQDIGLLQAHNQNLQAVNSTHAEAVKAKITNLQGWKWIFAAWRIWLVHFGFWVLLIFAYPKSPQIQAIFFWNPWVRRIIGLGYVEFLLTWIPFIRSRLFAPFKESLLADAKLDYADLEAYFPNSLVKIEASGKTQPLPTAIPKLQGQIILQVDSGLGKSLFLRHLVKKSQKIAVYLTADRCTEGVIEAIQHKLKGKAQDHNFLRNLIYSGAMDICIDGLNEVDADTRASIKQFVEDYFKGNIIISTQPLEWKPPATARIYILQPLTKVQIKEFLLSRQPHFAGETKLNQQEFNRACLYYLDQALNNNLSGEELAEMQHILSNPMDLTVLSQIIASNESPDIFSLQQQQYDLMAADYKSIQLEQFPLDRFSEHAHQMRLDNLPLSESDYLEELKCMERYKMVVCQQFLNSANEPVKEWKFRHDKISDFFAVQTFLKYKNCPSKHKQDPRFRGVYFLLVNLLSLEDAETLREELIQYAADTGDHTVSDRFVQLLRTRKAKSQ
ncbi:MAG: HEAT repeat domain-containing protein, partial [Cyanobacteria bacterium P01_G01_bin.39]